MVMTSSRFIFWWETQVVFTIPLAAFLFDMICLFVCLNHCLGTKNTMEMSIFYDSDFVEICIPDKLRS